MSQLRALARSGAAVSLSTAILAAYELRRPFMSEEQRERLADAYRNLLVDGLLRVFGAELTVAGERTYNTGALVVANHQSALDIGVMLSVFQGVLVSRHDVAEWPLLGRIARHGETIFVDRDDRHSGAKAVRAMRKQLRAGRTVVAFPEGSTFPEDDVHEFQPGAFAAVRSLDVPVVPVGLAYSPAVPYERESFVRHITKIAARPNTRIAVHVGEPLPPGLDPRTAASTARARVESLVIEARRRLEGH